MEDHWKLLRLCVKEIKEKEGKWTTRKIEDRRRKRKTELPSSELDNRE